MCYASLPSQVAIFSRETYLEIICNSGRNLAPILRLVTLFLSCIDYLYESLAILITKPPCVRRGLSQPGPRSEMHRPLGNEHQALLFPDALGRNMCTSFRVLIISSVQ